jgi:hypothetical protein
MAETLVPTRREQLAGAVWEATAVWKLDPPD